MYGNWFSVCLTISNVCADCIYSKNRYKWIQRSARQFIVLYRQFSVQKYANDRVRGWKTFLEQCSNCVYVFILESRVLCSHSLAKRRRRRQRLYFLLFFLLLLRHMCVVYDLYIVLFGRRGIASVLVAFYCAKTLLSFVLTDLRHGRACADYICSFISKIFFFF